MEKAMRRLKLKALEAHADFSFLVGPVKDEAEVCCNLYLITINHFHICPVDKVLQKRFAGRQRVF